MLNSTTGPQYKRKNLNSVPFHFFKDIKGRVFLWNSQGMHFRINWSLLETSIFRRWPTFARPESTNQFSNNGLIVPSQNRCMKSNTNIWIVLTGGLIRKTGDLYLWWRRWERLLKDSSVLYGQFTRGYCVTPSSFNPLISHLSHA